MRHGVLWLFVVFLSVVLNTVSAQEIAPMTRQSWLDGERVQRLTEEVKTFAQNGDVDSIIDVLEPLSLYEQEAIRFLLLEYIERDKMLITSDMAEYIKSLSLIPPAYQIRHAGDGYEFITPAFAYPSIANRILRTWQYDQKVQSFILAAERRELDLEVWLNEASSTENQVREKLLIEEMGGLSPPAVEFLVEQVIQADNKIVFWLPSNAVMVRLAQQSADSRVYKMLWRMKTDKHTQDELFRLMESGDEFSVRNIMDSASNPTLNKDVIQYLAAKKPQTAEIKAFLITNLSIKENERAFFVASELSKNGYDGWLKQLLNSNKSVNSSAIKQALLK